MVRRDSDGGSDEDCQKVDRVSLTAGNWAGVIAVGVSVVVIPLLALQGRLTTVESKADYTAARVDRVEATAANTRSEILVEIKELRSDIKQIGK